MFTLNDLFILMTASGFKQVECDGQKGRFTFRKEGLKGIYIDFFTDINKEDQTVIKSGYWMDEFDEGNNVTLLGPDSCEGWTAPQIYKALRKQIVRLVTREEARARLNRMSEEEIYRLAAEAERFL